MIAFVGVLRAQLMFHKCWLPHSHPQTRRQVRCSPRRFSFDLHFVLHNSMSFDSRARLRTSYDRDVVAGGLSLYIYSTVC